MASEMSLNIISYKQNRDEKKKKKRIKQANKQTNKQTKKPLFTI